MNQFQRSPIHIPIATHFLHFRHLELNNITQPTFFTSETSTICRSPAGISRKGRNWYSQSNYQTLPFWKYYGTIWKIVPNDQIWSNKGKVWFTMAMFISLPRPANAICASQAHQNLCVLDAHSHLSPWGMAGFFSVPPCLRVWPKKIPRCPRFFKGIIDDYWPSSLISKFPSHLLYVWSQAKMRTLSPKKNKMPPRQKVWHCLEHGLQG